MATGYWGRILHVDLTSGKIWTEEPDEAFYRKRNLLGVSILPEDVAEAVLFFAGDRSAKTTGCTLTVDGGVRDAFPR